MSVKERKRFGAVRGGLCRVGLECDAITIHSRNCRGSVQWAAPTSALQLPIVDKLDQLTISDSFPGLSGSIIVVSALTCHPFPSPLFQRTHETVFG